jgi:hypothetical protein
MAFWKPCSVDVYSDMMQVFGSTSEKEFDRAKQECILAVWSVAAQSCFERVI